jgi:hypothetical protein
MIYGIILKNYSLLLHNEYRCVPQRKVIELCISRHLAASILDKLKNLSGDRLNVHRILECHSVYFHIAEDTLQLVCRRIAIEIKHHSALITVLILKTY